MKGKWIKIIFVASLALNIAFISTSIYTNFFPKKIKPEVEFEFANGIKLNDSQKEKMNATMKNFKLELLRFKQDILEKRIDIIEELGDSEFSLENLENRASELNVLENQLNLIFVDTLVQINGILDSKQRIDFLYRLSKNWFFIENDSKGEKND